MKKAIKIKRKMKLMQNPLRFNKQMEEKRFLNVGSAGAPRQNQTTR